MERSTSFYYLYCINMHCSNSIFGRIKDVKLQLTVDNLLSTHFCANCNHPLTTSMEIEMEQMLAGTGVKSPDKPNYYPSN